MYYKSNALFLLAFLFMSSELTLYPMVTLQKIKRKKYVLFSKISIFSPNWRIIENAHFENFSHNFEEKDIFFSKCSHYFFQWKQWLVPKCNFVISVFALKIWYYTHFGYRNVFLRDLIIKQSFQAILIEIKQFLRIVLIIECYHSW